MDSNVVHLYHLGINQNIWAMFVSIVGWSNNNCNHYWSADDVRNGGDFSRNYDMKLTIYIRYCSYYHALSTCGSDIFLSDIFVILPWTRDQPVAFVISVGYWTIYHYAEWKLKQGISDSNQGCYVHCAQPYSSVWIYGDIVCLKVHVKMAPSIPSYGMDYLVIKKRNRLYVVNNITILNM